MYTKKDAQSLKTAYKIDMCPNCLYQKGCHRTLHVETIDDGHHRIQCDHYVKRPNENVLNQVLPDQKIVGGVKYGG